MNSVKFLIVVSVFCFVTINVFAQWLQIPSSPTGAFNNLLIVNDTLYAASNGNGVYKSTDNGNSWKQMSAGLNIFQSLKVNEVLFYNNDLYAATDDGIYKSTDNGNNWIKKSHGITIGPGATFEFCESIFEHEGILFTGSQNGIYRSTDNAENWTVTNISGQGISAKNITYHNGLLFAARETINDPVGYKSADSGLTWEELPPNPLQNTITFFSDSGKLWAGTISGVWLSPDDGLTWAERNNGLQSDPYSSCIIRINDKLITSLHFGGSAIFISSDEGLNWEDFGEGLTFLNTIEKLVVFGNNLIAATSNGLWQRDISEIVSVKEDKELPSGYVLYQNFPNPFNPTTKIKYSIPDVGASLMKPLRLTVYDILGNEVAILVNGQKPAGEYEVEFSGETLPSGIYFYQLRAGDFTDTKSFVLIK